MRSKNLICPACRNQFEFSLDETVFSGNILCPRCEVNLAYSEFKEMIFCPVCRTAVEVPAQRKENETPTCPCCSAQLLPAEKELSPWLQEGDLFDKYRIITRVGKGGMSEVYKAEHLLLRQTYALKILRNDRSQEYPLMYKRFLREGKCFHSIDHPNIIRVYDIGCDIKTGFLFIAMEYLDGGTLAEQENTRLPEDELLRLAEDMALALAELEKQQIVHRDIKPSNIMRSADGKYKLMDLGIAKISACDSNDYTLTVDQAIFGTPVYASPEQCEAPHNVDCRSDIYSLGATLYHLACGEPPFNGDSPLGIAVNVIGTTPPPLSSQVTDLSAQMVDLIERMMEKSPYDRPQNAAAVLEDISAIKDRRYGKHSRQHIYGAMIMLLVLFVSGTYLLKLQTVPANTENEMRTISRELKLFCNQLSDRPEVAAWRNPPSFDWHIHLAQALREARSAHKNVLVLMHREHTLPSMWRKEKFLRTLREKYVLMFAECSVNGMPEEQQRHIARLRRILRVADIVPAAAVISPDGEFIRLYKNINTVVP